MKPLDALRALGMGDEPPAEAKKRVFGALLASLDVAAAAAAGAVAPGVPRAPASLVPASTPLLAGVASSKAVLVAAGIWLFGGATGAALYAAWHPQQVRVVYVDRPVFSTLPAAASVDGSPIVAAASSSLGLAFASASPGGRNATPSIALSAANREGSDLAAERALLDAARAAAASGEPAQVLVRVEQHRRRFPGGHLVEEREALAIRALLALGRTPEAKARADAFRAAYPHSFLMPVIDSALSTP